MSKIPTEVYTDIAQLYSRYCFGLDGKDVETFLSCFTEDGVMAVGGLGDVAGHQALSEMVTNRTRGSRHQWLNMEVTDYDGTTAKSRAYFLLLSPEGQNAAYGEYRDDLVHDEDHGWRWTRRGIDFLWRAETYNYGKDSK